MNEMDEKKYIAIVPDPTHKAVKAATDSLVKYNISKEKGNGLKHDIIKEAVLGNKEHIYGILDKYEKESYQKTKGIPGHDIKLVGSMLKELNIQDPKENKGRPFHDVVNTLYYGIRERFYCLGE